jgi:hypothetical protein
MMFPEDERYILTRSSRYFSVKDLPPTAANRCPEWETLVAVRKLAEMLR